MPRVAQLAQLGAFGPPKEGYKVPGSAATCALDDGALVTPTSPSEKCELKDLDPEDRCEAGSSFEGKRWLEPQLALEAVQRLSSGSFSLAPARKAPPFGQRRCRLLGFWGTSGEEINEEMRWDGTTYSCHLEIPAREDAMFQVLVEGLGRMYPSIEGANLSIRHELLGPEEAHHDAAWFLDSARSKRRAWIFVACPQSCAVCLGWKFQGEEIPKETEDWREMGPWLISSHIGQGKQGAVVCTGRWPSAGKGGVAAVKYPVEAEELELYARVHDIPGLPDLLDFGRLPGPRTEKGEFYMAMSKIEPCLDILLRGQLHIHDTSPQTLGRISWPVVAGMGLRLLRTLQAIHKRGILHCDLKPGNILLHRRAPHVQLIDLGRAGYLGRILACAKWTLERVAPAKPLLFGATLRPATDSDRVTFAPLAFEWAEGPAADPLQLALQLSMSTEEVKLQVEMISGGWSDWSESWSLEAGTLQVEMSIAICGQDEGDKLMLHQVLGAECLEVTGEAHRVATAEKLIAVVCLSQLRWGADAPPWRPRELRRLETRARA